MPPLSILYVIDGLEFGGGERVFLQLIKRLRQQYRIAVATAEGGLFAEAVRELGITLHPVDMTRQWSLKPMYQIRNILRKQTINIVHSQGARADVFSRISSRAYDVRNVCTIAMPVEGFDVGIVHRVIYRVFDRLTERYVDRYIVVSDVLETLLHQQRGVSLERITRIYNGIEVDEYNDEHRDTQTRAQCGIPDDAFLVVAIGRMVWQKGFDVLIHAWSEIASHVPNARLLFVGDGSLRGTLERLTHDVNIRDRVTFRGFEPDVRPLLATADLVAVPSRREGFPMVILEAMAMAKPIVATRIDGVTEQMVDGVSGLLVPPSDPAALANGIVGLATHRERAVQLGRNARARVQQEFSVRRMVETTDSVYRSL